MYSNVALARVYTLGGGSCTVCDVLYVIQCTDVTISMVNSDDVFACGFHFAVLTISTMAMYPK